ncbi:MAG: penicillin-binding protein 2 [Epsilonproteobacteria bacterium]|nr:penicillin-binding protein 2 [Campylobacterota bacterium]
MKTERDIALRGGIYSKNNFTISASKKLYCAEVDTRNIDPDKFELFVKLFSIFSKMDPHIVREKLQSNFGYVKLNYALDSKSARYVKQLRANLIRYGILKHYEDPTTGESFLHALSVTESGEYREFPLEQSLAPVVGFMGKDEIGTYRTIKGKYGLEKFYDDALSGIQSTMINGRKDVNHNIILDKKSEVKTRVDGLDVITSIDLKLQKRIEEVLDHHRERTDAKEIIASIMESRTGQIVAVASSRRYNPIKITDVASTTISATRYMFEPGSVLKPITFALLLEEKKIHPHDIIDTENGRFHLGKKIITDEHPYDYLSAENVIVHSSNIGMIKLSQKLDEIDFFQGLREFGFSRKSGIDISDELSGSIPNIHQLKHSAYKATASYGYGMKVNFFQLLSAYNIFNNNGKWIKPSIGSFYRTASGEKQRIETKKPREVLHNDIAYIMNHILRKTVKEGTGKKTYIEGLKIGGKTGTAHISVKGVYANVYNSSFYGFANDQKDKYTIGVTVIEPTTRNALYFASQSAVPVFKDMVNVMIEQKLLKPIGK